MLDGSIIKNETESYILPKSPLVFMHIPKTGGMSLFTAFTSLWGESIADFYNISSLHPEPAGQLVKDHNKVLYCGHYAYGMHDWFDRPVYYASVLREPVARMVSLYYFCLPMLCRVREALQKVGGDIGQITVPDFYLDFKPYLKFEQSAAAFFASPCAELDNGMVRRFSGYGLNPVPCPADALELAKQNIEQKFSLVGLLERYPETLQLMANTFRLPELSENHINANPQGKEKNAPLSPVIIEKIRSMNELDLALYAWVANQFDSRLKETRPPIAVSGCSRNDLNAMPLWRAVGQSPLREAAMQQRGVLAPKQLPTQVLVCKSLVSCAYNDKVIISEVDTVTVEKDGSGKSGPRTRIVLPPQTAKQMALNLAKAVDEYEKKHGVIL